MRFLVFLRRSPAPPGGSRRRRGARVSSSYRGLVMLMAVLMIGLGVSMLAFTLARGGGVGVVLGSLFVVAGAGRLYLLRKRVR